MPSRSYEGHAPWRDCDSADACVCEVGCERHRAETEPPDRAGTANNGEDHADHTLTPAVAPDPGVLAALRRCGRAKGW